MGQSLKLLMAAAKRRSLSTFNGVIPNFAVSCVSGNSLIAAGWALQLPGIFWAEAHYWSQSGGLILIGATHGTYRSNVNAANTDGSVLVGVTATANLYYDYLGESDHAFRWTQAGGMIDLGTITGGHVSRSTCVSADGSVVAGVSNNADYVNCPFIWTAGGGMTNLGSLGGAGADVTGMTPDGSVIVGWSINASLNERAFRWTAAGGLEDLGTLGGLISLAKAVSDDGSVVVGSSPILSSEIRVFRWTQAGGMVDIGTLGGLYSDAVDTSPDGNTIVGLSDTVDNIQHAFRWTLSGGMIDLGYINQATDVAVAHSVSDNGAVVAGITIIGGTDTAFKWTLAGGMVEIPVPQVILDATTGIWPESVLIIETVIVSPDGSKIFVSYRDSWSGHFYTHVSIV